MSKCLHTVMFEVLFSAAYTFYYEELIIWKTFSYALDGKIKVKMWLTFSWFRIHIGPYFSFRNMYPRVSKNTTSDSEYPTMNFKSPWWEFRYLVNFFTNSSSCSQIPKMSSKNLSQTSLIFVSKDEFSFKIAHHEICKTRCDLCSHCGAACLQKKNHH